jgi:2-dehydropantoate 2-reductase
MRRHRIAIVGVGAIGGAIAADLFDTGSNDLELFSRTPFDELVVHHPDGTSRVRLPARNDASQCRPVDWVLLATKAHQSPNARPWLDALCDEDTIVAVLQNGVDHDARIAPLLGAGGRVLPVVVQLPAEKTAPGRVEQSRNGALLVPDDAVGRAFARLFEGARTRVVTTPDLLTQAWWKLISNAALGGVCALTLRENGIAQEGEVRALVLCLMREVAEVGRAEGAKLPDDAPEKALGVMVGAAPDHTSSIAVDRREGRAMEWEVRNAVVGRLGRAHGIATPYNDAITTLLRLADEGRGRD